MTKYDLKSKAPEILSNLLLELKKLAVPGATSLDLEKYAEKYLKKHGATPFNLNYHPKWASAKYPNILCICKNSVIAHGVPNDTPFVEGDIVNIDTAITYKGWCADAALMVGIGNIEHPEHNLLRFSKRVLYAGIHKIKAGVTNWEVAEEMYHTARKYNLNVNMRFTGHGIGKEMHEEPKVPAFKMVPGTKDEVAVPIMKLEAGQVVCLEPMVTRGNDVFGALLKDAWTTVTQDGKKSAMWEHMVLVTETGYKVLTTHFDETE